MLPNAAAAAHNDPPPQYTESDDMKPPDYSQVVNNRTETATNVEPPSYESIFGTIRAAHEQHASSNKLLFLKKVLSILMNTMGYTILLSVMYVMPVTMIVIGSLKANECPVESQIPLFLIVFGTVLTVKNTLSIYQQLKRHRDNSPTADEHTKKHPIEGILDAFLLIWFVTGNIWVYRVYDKKQLDNKELSNYCDKLVYLFAFWSITAVYMLLGLCLCCCCCVFCTALVFNQHQPPPTNAAPMPSP